MSTHTNTKHILILGNNASAAKADLAIGTDVIVDTADSIEEMADKKSRGRYDRIIIDPVFLAKSGVEILSPKNKQIDYTSAVAYIDLKFDFIWANRHYERMCGCSVHNLIGRNYFEVHSAPENLLVFERVIETGLPEKIEPACTVSPLRNRPENVYGLVLSIADLTHRGHVAETGMQPENKMELQSTIADLRREVEERQRTEDALAQARLDAERRTAEIESFVSGMTDGIALFDADGNVHLINKAGQRLLEVGPRMLHKDWTAAVLHHTIDGDPLPIEEIPSFRALRSETVVDGRYKLITRSGRQVVASVSAAPVRNSRKEVIGATLVFRDISDLVAFEDQRREVYEREHRIAEILQQALIPPQVNYCIERCKIAVKYQPALEEAAVGGDFYDIFEMDDGKVGILIGDIAGKGLPAAMRVAAVRYAVRSYAFLDPSPAVVMTLANQALCKEDADEIGLLTAFFAVVDVHTGNVTYANGGHEPPVVRTADGRVEELDLHGGGLGFYDGFIYAEAHLQLNPGDVLVMVTDGITEARSPNRDLFDKEGLIRYLSESNHTDLDSLAQGLVEEARSHADGNLQDDAAVVMLQMEDVLEVGS